MNAVDIPFEMLYILFSNIPKIYINLINPIYMEKKKKKKPINPRKKLKKKNMYYDLVHLSFQ